MALTDLRQSLARQLDSPHWWLRLPVRAARHGMHRWREIRTTLSTPWRRALLWRRIMNPGQVHQTTPTTWEDRYPQHFAAAAQYLSRFAAPRVLSFGCSTGEEVLTLRRYLTTARIVGAEINPASLAACRRHAVDERIRFIRSSRAQIRREGPYDAIFCMAVLQRTPHKIEEEQVANIARHYPFALFDRQLRDFDELLTPGGLLVVHHAQYRFIDSSIAGRYGLLPGSPVERRSIPFFGPDGSRLPLADGVGSMWLKGRTE